MTDKPQNERLSLKSFTEKEVDDLAVRADLKPSVVDIVKMSFRSSYEGIAKAKDIPLGTVKSRLNRARLRLVAARRAASAAP